MCYRTSARRAVLGALTILFAPLFSSADAQRNQRDAPVSDREIPILVVITSESVSRMSADCLFEQCLIAVARASVARALWLALLASTEALNYHLAGILNCSFKSTGGKNP